MDTDQPELSENMDAVFLQVRRDFLPFFIERSQFHKSDLLRIKFEDIDTETDAEQLLKAEIYLPLELLPELEGNAFYYHEIMGFTIIDEKFGEVGTIIGVNDSTAQALFVIDREGQEILIPMNDEFINKVDRDSKTIEVVTPEGLIDLYLD